MFLIEKRSPAQLFSPLLSPSVDKSHHPSAFAHRFDDCLAARLRSLLPVASSPAAGIPLSWFSRAVRVLALTLSDAAALISDPGSSTSDRAALAAHLDSGVALLDAANAVAAEVERLLRRRLLLRFALHLLSSDASPRRARESIAEWRSYPSRGIRSDAGDLVRSLEPSGPPRGKTSAVRRVIYAVEAVSGLIVGAVVAMLGGGEPAEIRVPAEFPWAREYEKLSEAVSGKRGGALAAEAEAVEAAVQKLTDVMDEETTDTETEKAERIRRVAEETEKATEELTVGLETLSTDVNGLFRAALGTRNTALQSFRTAGAHKCK